LNAIDRGKQKRSMADIRSIGTAVEAYAVDNSKYPVATDMNALKVLIEPVYIKTMPVQDGWANPLQVTATAVDYTIWSTGKDGSGSTCTIGTTNSFNDEICFVNGQFSRYPAGVQQ